MKKIALVKCRNGIWQAFEKVLIEREIKPTLIDVFKTKDLELLLNSNWDGLIWSAKHTPKIKNLAKKILFLFDEEKETKVFPDWNSYWHYDDKVSQYFLFLKNNFPIPSTKVFFNVEDATNYLINAEYPLIFKSAHGAGSTNVSIIKSDKQALKTCIKIFGKGIKTYFKNNIQKGYLLAQEFAKNNEGDYRLVCYGDEVLGFFRENRNEEPLASGSSKFVFKEIPSELLTLVHSISKKMNYSVMSYDLIKGNNNSWIITEISVVYGEFKEQAYNKAKVYKLLENKKWEEIITPGGHYERVASHILNSWISND